jgi:anti-sigma B factor antagonist
MSATDGFPRGGRASPLARVESSEHDGIRVVSVTGELDISNVAMLEQASFGLANDSLGIVLDLSETSYIDSSTLGVMFKLQHSLRRRGQKLRVVCRPDSSAHRVLELTGFHREVECESDRERALVALRADVAVREG